MKRWLLSMMVFSNLVSAQTVDRLTLSQTYDLAQKNYPVIKQKALVEQTANITIENLQKGFLPQLTVNGQATYQSDVTGFNISFGGINIQAPDKDQYKVVGDLNQLIYDGGVIRQQKVAAHLNADVQQQQVEVELYQLKDRVNQVYLSILFLDEEIKQANLTKQDILSGIKRVEVQVKNGVALRSGLNQLQAQLLQNEQRTIELKETRKGLIQTLALFLNQSLNEETIVFERPVVNVNADSSISRPELKLYNDQSSLALHQSKLITSKNLPRVSLFAQGGYGKPGLDFLKNESVWFYTGGVRFTWPFGGLYTIKKEKQQTEVNKEMIDVQKETFILNTNTTLKKQWSEIEKYIQIEGRDEEIIDLREQVKKASLAQLENGVITADDYLRMVNEEDQARQSLIIHQIQLLQAQINYLTTLGKQ
ncbi:MAG TPA: TolC family protein [Chitinophagaceae bacterium]|nr:TolC family protein [Chitinophagaceae bacterium]